MQFLVFAAFAMVLSVPESGPPWPTIQSAVWTWGIVLGHVALVGIVGGVSSRLVKRRLEQEPAWVASAQACLAHSNFILRVIIALGFGASVYWTAWVQQVDTWPFVARIWGLDELLVLAPFFAGVLVSWITLYPADQAVRRVALDLQLWGSNPARPVWSLWQYLDFMFRQHVLIIAAPMTPIVVAYDFSQRYSDAIYEATGVFGAHEAVVAVVAGLVFLVAPVMLRYIWHTRPLPPGELRDRLEQLCRRSGLTYRRILIWESDGMIVNAAVMGLFRRVRYILLSDGLLEMMDDEKIEAVFGHEAGHIKHRHIYFYLLFAVLSMLIVGGITELVMRGAMRWPDLMPSREVLADYLQVAAMGLIILVWGLGFGVVSRRFEWQADLFGAQSVTPPEAECDQPCFVHGTAISPSPQPESSASPVCSTAATLFADALQRIAELNGIPVDARSWRHSSISNRIHLLKQAARDPIRPARLGRAVIVIKMILLTGTTVGLVIAAWLYWPDVWTRALASGPGAK